MIIVDILRIIVGLILALFLPGYILARLAFKELSELEKIGLGFILSICIDIFLGLLLGYNKNMKDITGGITAFNLWLYLSIITIMLAITYVLFNKREVLDFMSRIGKPKQKKDDRFTLNIVPEKEGRKILIRKAQPSDFKHNAKHEHELHQQQIQREKER